MSIDQQYEEAIHSGNLDLGLELALKQASTQGYSVSAWHGTFENFDEFRKHDIGFHFSKDITIAQNRENDKLEQCYNDSEWKIIHVVLSINNPITVNADLGSWNAKDILGPASFKYTKIPFESQTTMYIYEQRQWARAAHKILKSIGIDKETAIEMYSGLKQRPELDTEYTELIRNRLIQSKYDAIIYPNDFESQQGFDQTCYIVFKPNQIKQISPVIQPDGSLRKLSSRFTVSSDKFTY